MNLHIASIMQFQHSFWRFAGCSQASWPLSPLWCSPFCEPTRPWSSSKTFKSCFSAQSNLNGTNQPISTTHAKCKPLQNVAQHYVSCYAVRSWTHQKLGPWHCINIVLSWQERGSLLQTHPSTRNQREDALHQFLLHVLSHFRSWNQ